MRGIALLSFALSLLLCPSNLFAVAGVNHEAAGGPAAPSVGIEIPDPPDVGPVTLRADDDADSIVSAPTFGCNVRIGTSTSVSSVAIDYDSSSGKLFAVLQESGGLWRFYRSLNGGESWSGVFNVSGSAYEAEMAAVGGYAYIAYVVSTPTAEQIRLRRAIGSTGEGDAVYDRVDVANTYPHRVEKLVLVTNQINQNDIFFLAALLDDGTVRVWWDDADDGTTPVEYSPGVSDAASGLAMAWNHDGPFLGASLVLTYIGDDGEIHLHRIAGIGLWDGGQVITSGLSLTGTTSVAAATNVILVAFEQSDGADRQDARYRVSYNGGSTWTGGTLGDASATGGSYFTPAVSASSRTGFACLMQQDTGGLPGDDTYWFRERFNYTNSSWHDPVALNDHDFSYGPSDFKSDFQWMGHGWGMAYVRNDGEAWFAWSRSIRYSGFELSGLLEW